MITRDPLTVADYDRFFRGLFPGKSGDNRTCDGLKAGSLARKVSRVGVSWMATRRVIEQALKLRTDLIVHHEPLYYTHWDNDAKRRDYESSKLKRKLLAKNRTAVYRVHDAWDYYPEFGIHDAWVEQLEGILEPEPARGVCMCAAPSIQFSSLLSRVRKRMGLEYVLAGGDLSKKIRHVWLGIGALGIAGVEGALEHGADCLIAGEQVEWEAVRLAEDSGLAIGLVGHCASENAGMRKMVDFLQERMPGPEYYFLDAGHPLKSVR